MAAWAPRAGADAGYREGLLGAGELHGRAQPVAPGSGAGDPSRLFRGRRGHGGNQHLRRLPGHARRIRPVRPRVRDQQGCRRAGARGRGKLFRRPPSLGDRQRRAGHQAAILGNIAYDPLEAAPRRAVPRADRRRGGCDPDRDLPGHAADQGRRQRRQDRPRWPPARTRRSSCRSRWKPPAPCWSAPTSPPPRPWCKRWMCR